MKDLYKYTIAELLEFADQWDQQIGEMECQHLSETALYGDSGPGQALAIRESNGDYAKFLAAIEARRLAFVGPEPLTGLQLENFEYDQAALAFVGPPQDFPF